ncbi:MAG TPA: STAS domain-containing protein [Bacteroidales bacterium]|nr:STAS domain-containing protein [Bacteroidales bacterium]
MVNIEKTGNVEIVRFTINKINALVTDDIREQVKKLFEHAGSKVILDLTGVEYIDSTGFSCLLSCYRESKNNYGTLKISSPEPPVRKLFELLHLNTVFDISSDTDSCIRSFR